MDEAAPRTLSAADDQLMDLLPASGALAWVRYVYRGIYIEGLLTISV
jgi:hypothetical protein